MITARAITNVESDFVADPFMIFKNRLWYLFFELFRGETGTGEIGVAVSNDLLSWEYQGVILREPFHLSYPYVFEWEGCDYMVPETLGADEIRLYRSEDFPRDWRLVRSLMRGQHADPSIFRHEESWWMFACDLPFEHSTLRLYNALALEGPWKEHPESPIVENDRSIARPAGRVIIFDGRVIRFAQDCSRRYGEQVWAFEITHLSRDRFRERRALSLPVIGTLNVGGWRTSRMHHIDAHPDPDGGWVACVDGWPAGLVGNVSA